MTCDYLTAKIKLASLILEYVEKLIVKMDEAYQDPDYIMRVKKYLEKDCYQRKFINSNAVHPLFAIYPPDIVPSDIPKESKDELQILQLRIDLKTDILRVAAIKHGMDISDPNFKEIAISTATEVMSVMLSWKRESGVPFCFPALEAALKSISAAFDVEIKESDIMSTPPF